MKAIIIYFSNSGTTEKLAKRIGKHFMREDGKFGNIIYNPDKVR